MRRFSLFCFLAALTVAGAGDAEASRGRRIIVGYVERVYVPTLKATVKAKLDTGAKTSSIHAEIVDIREVPTEETAAKGNNGAAAAPTPTPGKKKPKKRKRIIFTIEDENGDNKTLEREILRWVKIKDKKGGYIRRPVVEMEFCVAGVPVKGEVNLAQRGNFLYLLLMGRNMLTNGSLVVDPSLAFTSRPNCPELKSELK